MQVVVQAPIPPSVNHYYTVANGRKILSRQARKFIEEVGVECLRQDVGHVIGRVSVQIWVYSNIKRDLDNLLKGSLDALVQAGVLEDDSQIDEITIYRRTHGDNHNPSISVKLTGDVPKE